MQGARGKTLDKFCGATENIRKHSMYFFIREINNHLYSSIINVQKKSYLSVIKHKR